MPVYATAPALMYVGLLMLSNVTKLDFNDFIDAMAGLLCAVFIVLTCNIVTGIMLGFSSLVIGRIFSGEWRKLNIGTVLIAVALVAFTPAAGRFKLFGFPRPSGGEPRRQFLLKISLLLLCTAF